MSFYPHFLPFAPARKTKLAMSLRGKSNHYDLSVLPGVIYDLAVEVPCSQFLGYTLGFLAVLLTQKVNPALSPALPALMLGLPIADIIAVFAQRIYHKMNWFKATRNHIHHRLLDLGFHHYESVVIVYSIQALLVVSAVVLPYAADALIVGSSLKQGGLWSEPLDKSAIQTMAETFRKEIKAYL